MDRRELILERLVTIAGTIGVRKVMRNNIRPAETDLPAVVILDADEAADPDDPGGRGPRAPRRMIMTPQVLILLAENARNVGPTLSEYRVAMVRAVAFDDALTALTTNLRGARLLKTETSLAWGRSMLGEMGLSFAIPYVLEPENLPASTI